MIRPSTVEIDLIVDPYVLRIFPTSLLPTFFLVSTLAPVAWYISGMTWFSLRVVTQVWTGKYHAE